MGTYTLQVICFQALFLAVYYFLLRKETFFIYNRIYLLVTPLLALVIPLVKIMSLQTVVPVEMITILLPEIVIGETSVAAVETAEVADTFDFPWSELYITGVMVSVVLLGLKIRKFVSFLSFKNTGQRIIELPASREAFTFFNYIFIGEEIDSLSRKQILAHEHIHVKQGHTWDLIFFEVLKIVFWFNPLVYLYQKYISIIHEYLADQKATQGIAKKDYYQELLNTAFGTSNLSFTNTFFNSSFIKKRIIMLQKSKSRKRALLKYTCILPLMMAMLIQVAWAQGGPTAQETDPLNERDFVLLQTKFTNGRNSLTVGTRDLTKLTTNQKAFLKKIKEDESIKIRDFSEGESVDNPNLSQLLMFDGNDKIEALIDSYKLEVVDTHKWAEDNKKRFATRTTFTGDVEENQDSQLDIPYAVIDKVPVYPGCEGLTSNEELKKCMSDKVSRYVNQQYDVTIAKPLGLTDVNRIFIAFRVNKSGNVDNVKVRAPHPQLAEEAKRVVYSLPKMKPGEQNGEVVGVLYSIPITFQVN